MARPLLLAATFVAVVPARTQDTFSIAAVDPATGEVGSAGASCVNLFQFGITDPGFLAQQLPGVGSINTQAYYLAANQNNAMARLQAGDSPAQVIAWLQANDAQGNPAIRQYGVVRISGGAGESAAHTGSGCQAFAGHLTGPTYAIQGNILLGASILEQMEQNFLGTTGTLADKLMAALQGANVPGADTRCLPYGTSSLFAFLEVAQPGDPFNQPSLSLGVRLPATTTVEPIDSLQSLYGTWLSVHAQGGASVDGLTIAPNPGDGSFIVTLPGGCPAAGMLRVHDATGALVSELVAAPGTRLPLDLRGAAPGLYHLHFRCAGRGWNGRLVRR